MTLSGHFDDDLAEAVKTASASDSKQHGAISRWIVEACRQRLEREGMLPGDRKAEIWAAIDEIGIDRALKILSAKAR